MRTDFDLDPSLIYLNSGTHSITPRPVLDAIDRYRREFEMNPTANLFENWGKLWNVQKELAGFLGAQPADLFLRANVTEAMNEFIMGAPLPRDSEILVSDLEYGAIVNICRYRAERDGLKLRTFAIPTDRAWVSEEELAAYVIAAIGPDTKMLMISHVMTGTGLKLPIARIGAFTRSRDIQLAVDGAHATGALAMDFATLAEVDYYGGNLHKWMLGPKGTGFGWVAPRRQVALSSQIAGWTTFEYPAPFKAFGDGNRFQGRMLMANCHDWAPFYAIHDMIEFWRRQGAEKIRARHQELRSRLESLMAERAPAFRPAAPPAFVRGPLLAWRLPDSLAAKGYELMFQILREDRLQVAIAPLQGGFALRLAPQVYNTEEELERAVSLLARRAGA